MPVLLGRSLKKYKLGLETRKKQPIANEMDMEPCNAGHNFYSEALKKQFTNQSIHRPVGPTNAYNCHGLTFASRRTAIFDSNEVRKILADDEYTQVEIKDVLPGDIVIWISNEVTHGDIEHSGIVVERTQLNFKVLSKWNALQEVIHFVNDCPYDSTNLRFYRMYK